MEKLKIEYVAIEEVKPYKNNPFRMKTFIKND